MSESPFRPQQVDDLADRVERYVGVRPIVTEIASRHWEVRLAGEHVTAIGYYKLRPMDGRVKFIPGDLYIDGSKSRRSEDLKDLANIWRRYELGEIAAIPELPGWTGDLESVPPGVRKVYENLVRDQYGPDGEQLYQPVLSFTDDTWYVGADSGPGLAGYAPDKEPGCIRIAHVRPDGAPAHVWLPAPELSWLVRDGIRTPVASVAELTRMLMEMVNAHKAQPASPGTGPIRQGSTATPGKANSVAARRASVRRV